MYIILWQSRFDYSYLVWSLSSNAKYYLLIQGEKTGGLMGVSEMVVGCCFCGCMMALFSGQPFLIVGSTGPLLVFEEAVYQVRLSLTYHTLNILQTF